MWVGAHFEILARKRDGKQQSNSVHNENRRGYIDQKSEGWHKTETECQKSRRKPRRQGDCLRNQTSSGILNMSLRIQDYEHARALCQAL